MEIKKLLVILLVVSLSSGFLFKKKKKDKDDKGDDKYGDDEYEDYDDSYYDIHGDIEDMFDDLKAQLADLSTDYRSQVDQLNMKFSKVEMEQDIVEDQLYQLHGDYKRLDIEYENLERKYDVFEDRCKFSDENFYEPPEYLKHGWKLIFRALRGNGQSVLEAWNGNSTTDSFSRNCDRIYCYSCNHWKSFIVDKWDVLGVNEIKIELYKNDERKAFIKFNGRGSTANNWFDKSRVVASSWYDLSPTGTYQHFDMSVGLKEFAIVRQYANCVGDEGWLAILGERDDQYNCDWFHRRSYPTFLYSAGNDRWPFSAMHQADVMNIYITCDNHEHFYSLGNN